MRAVLAALVLSAAPATASAGAYDILSWKPDRLAAVERDSVQDVGALKHVRITIVFAEPRTDKALPYRGLTGLQEFDCAAGRYRTLERMTFDDGGAPIVANTMKEPTDWVAITPGTLGDDERRRVCAGEWSERIYRTSLPTLMAAFLLRPEPPGVRQAASADDHAQEASAAPGP